MSYSLTTESTGHRTGLMQDQTQTQTQVPPLSSANRSRLTQILHAQMGVADPSDVGYNSCIENSVSCIGGLRLDSLDLVEVVIALEKEFGIEISDDELPTNPRDTTVGILDAVVSVQVNKSNYNGHSSGH